MLTNVGTKKCLSLFSGMPDVIHPRLVILSHKCPVLCTHALEHMHSNVQLHACARVERSDCVVHVHVCVCVCMCVFERE